jgi:hypothetical protein
MNSQRNTGQKEQSWRCHNTQLQTVLQSDSKRKTVWFWHKNRYDNQWYGIEDPDMSSCYHAHLIFDKGAKNMMEKRQPVQQILLGKVVSACCKLKLDLCLSPCTSFNSKWIIDFNIRPETLKLVQERAGNIQEAIGIGNDKLKLLSH